MLRRLCKERDLQIDYRRRAYTRSSCLLLKSDEWENENIANGWEMFSLGDCATLHDLSHAWSQLLVSRNSFALIVVSVTMSKRDHPRLLLRLTIYDGGRRCVVASMINHVFVWELCLLFPFRFSP